MEQILHYTLVFLIQVQPVVVTHFQPYQQDISTIANQQVHTKIQMEQVGSLLILLYQTVIDIYQHYQ